MNLPILIIFLFVSFKDIPKGQNINPKYLFVQINDYRKSNNLPELIYLDSRQKETDKFSRGLPKRLAHGPRSDFYENISMTYDSSRVLPGWINSIGHNRNLLNKQIKYTTISIYKVMSDNGTPIYYSVFRGYVNRKTR